MSDKRKDYAKAKKSNARGFDVDLSTRGRNAKRKPSKRRIIANIVGSVMMVLSTVTLVGILMLSMKPFTGSGETEDNSSLESIIKSSNADVVYFLVAGLDRSENLSDVMMVVCYDIAKKSANILQIPRDTYVGTEVATGYTAKLNAVYGHPRKGEAKVKALIRVLNNQFGLPIDHYITVDLQALREIVDAVGGITVKLDYQIKVQNFVKHQKNIKIGPGEVKLNGELAEGFMRERYSYATGDTGRMLAQRKFYAAFVDKMLKMSTSQMTKIAKSCFDKIQTDLSIGELLGFASSARSLSLKTIGIYSVPGTPKYFTPPGFSQRLSYYSADLNKYIDLVYEKMNPYGDVKYDGINIHQVHSSSDYLSEVDGKTLDEIKN